ncbi:MAG: ScpA family protein [Elainellaceae cyanobacterium]
MAISLAQNAIALLIDLAEQGEINPWDVKVIEVIDRFLSKLQPGTTAIADEEGRAPYESELSESGQAFLYASMLLLLKADSLARQEVETPDQAEIDAEFFEGEGLATPLPPNLERKIRRRAVAPPAPNRRVTLQELIAQLHLMAAAIAEQKPRRLVNRRPRPQSRSQAIRAIAQLAHQENLSEVAAILEQFLSDYWQDDPDQSQNWLDFEILLDLWTNAQVEPPAKKPADSPPPAVAEATVHDRVGVFWALLFLSSQSKVELLQEEFYQDLKVRKLDLETPPPHPDLANLVLPD